MMCKLKQERRREERYPLMAIAVLEIHLDNSVQQLQMSTRDISSAGAFFFTSHPLPIGVNVRIRLHLLIEGLKSIGYEHNVRLDVGGTVVRKEADGIAVGFDRNYTLSPQGQSRL